jgi:RNA polymerase sigma-70 factor, ECF subfamily
MQDEQRRIAFESLYAEHAAPVYRFALRISGNPDDAEDLAAQALARAYRKWSGYRGEASPRTWLFSIVLNEWKMIKRKRPVQEHRLECARHLAVTMRFADPDLAHAIASLADDQREAFLLVKAEGLTHAEAAKVARVPVGTMYSRVHEAVTKLRAKLGPQSKDRPLHSEVVHEM